MNNAIPLIPNLCRLPVVLAVILVTELVVVIYVLSISSLLDFDWTHLSLLSLYAQWIALLALGALCQCRHQINSFEISWGIAASFIIMLLVVLLTNSGAQWIYLGANFEAWHWSWHWLLRDTIILAVIFGLCLHYLYIQQCWRAEQRASERAKLEALQARIRPHFFFNSMNTIASLIAYAPEDAEKAVEDLAALFRVSLTQRKPLVSWQEEWDLCLAYLRIEQQRLGERLQLDIDLDSVPASLELPPLCLQPLIENAIYHGIERLPEGGVLSVVATKQADCIHFEVNNPLVEAGHTCVDDTLVAAKALNETNSGDSVLPDVKRGGASHHGIALNNIRSRLAAIYRHEESGELTASLDLSQQQGVFTAKLVLPLKAHSTATEGR